MKRAPDEKQRIAKDIEEANAKRRRTARVADLFMSAAGFIALGESNGSGSGSSNSTSKSGSGGSSSSSGINGSNSSGGSSNSRGGSVARAPCELGVKKECGKVRHGHFRYTTEPSGCPVGAA